MSFSIKKVISGVLAVQFILADLAMAAPDLKISMPVFEGTESRILAKARKEHSFIPDSVAFLEDAWQAPGKDARTLYLIQDAHTNPSAQLNTARALDLLLKQKNKPEFIFLEAGAGHESLSSLRSSADLLKRKRVAESFLRDGKLQGVEYLDLTTDHAFTAWGVEDPSLYIESLEIYREITQKREKLENYLSHAEITLNSLKSRVYNPFLFEFDKKYSQARKDEISLTDYTEELLKQAKDLGISLKAYPNLRKTQRLKALERNIDFTKANQEEKEAIANLSEEDLKELKQASPVSFEKNAPEEGFFALLSDVIARNEVTKQSVHKDRHAPSGLAMTAYPELSKYLKYRKQAQALDPSAFLKEQKELEGEVISKLSTSADELYLFKSASVLEYFKKLLALTLTPEEYREYLSLKKDFTMTQIAGFLNRKIHEGGDFYERAVFLEESFDPTIQKSKQFYELTRQRDRVFIENFRKKMGSDHSTAVLITGGFHTPHLKELLQKENISYVSLVPRVLNETNQKRYEKLLLSQDLKTILPAPAQAHALATVRFAGWGSLDELNDQFTPLGAPSGSVETPSVPSGTLLPVGARLAFSRKDAVTNLKVIYRSSRDSFDTRYAQLQENAGRGEFPPILDPKKLEEMRGYFKKDKQGALLTNENGAIPGRSLVYFLDNFISSNKPLTNFLSSVRDEVRDGVHAKDVSYFSAPEATYHISFFTAQDIRPGDPAFETETELPNEEKEQFSAIAAQALDAVGAYSIKLTGFRYNTADGALIAVFEDEGQTAEIRHRMAERTSREMPPRQSRMKIAKNLIHVTLLRSLRQIDLKELQKIKEVLDRYNDTFVAGQNLTHRIDRMSLGLETQWLLTGIEEGSRKEVLLSGARLPAGQAGLAEIQEIGENLFVFGKFFPRHFNVLKNFLQKTLPDIFALVHGHYRGAAVGMSEKSVAAMLANLLETKIFEYSDYFYGFKRDKSRAQTATRTSWRPINFRGLGAFFWTLTQSSIASLTRFNSSGIVLAWVWQPLSVGTVATSIPSSSSSIKTKYSNDIKSLLKIEDSMVSEASQARPDGARLPAGQAGLAEVLIDPLKIDARFHASIRDMILAVSEDLKALKINSVSVRKEDKRDMWIEGSTLVLALTFRDIKSKKSLQDALGSLIENFKDVQTLDRLRSASEMTGPEDELWLSFKSEPTIESVKKAIHLTVEWLEKNGYPHMEVLKNYEEHLNRPGNLIASQSSGSILAKAYDEDRSSIVFYTMPEIMHDLFEGVQQARSRSLFVGIWASSIVREAWGHKFLGLAYQSHLKEVRDKVMSFHEEIERKSGELKSEDLVSFMSKDGIKDQLVWLVAQNILPEFFESSREMDFMNWADQAGIHSEEAARRAAARSVHRRLTNSYKMHYGMVYARRGDAFEFFKGQFALIVGMLNSQITHGFPTSGSVAWDDYLSHRNAVYSKSGGRDGISSDTINKLMKGTDIENERLLAREAEVLYPIVQKEMALLNQKLGLREKYGARLAQAQDMPKLAAGQILPASTEFQEKGGWKLHLSVDPVRYQEVHEWLYRKFAGTNIGYKHLAAEEGSEKSFTIYIGSKKKADDLSKTLSNEIGHLIRKPQADILNTDIELAPKIWGRFDAENKYGMSLYGGKGLPFPARDVVNLMKLSGHMPYYAPTDEEKQQVAELKRIYTKNSFDKLRESLGEYFTGGASRYEDLSPKAGARLAQKNRKDRQKEKQEAHQESWTRRLFNKQVLIGSGALLAAGMLAAQKWFSGNQDRQASKISDTGKVVLDAVPSTYVATTKPAEQNDLWLLHKSEPTLEGAIKTLYMVSDWLRVNGYPHMDVIENYLRYLKNKDQCKILEGGVNMADAAKLVDQESGKIIVLLNAAKIYQRLVESQATRSQSVFIETMACLLVRESWGVKAVEAYPRWFDEASEEYIQLAKKFESSSYAQNSDGMALFGYNNLDSIRSIVAKVISFEYFELLSEMQYLRWAIDRSFYSLVESNEAVDRSGSNLLNRVHYSFENLVQTKEDFLALFGHEFASYASLCLAFVSEGGVHKSGPMEGGLTAFQNYMALEEIRYRKTGGREGLPSDLIESMLSGRVRPTKERFSRQIKEMYPLVKQIIDQRSKLVEQKRNSGARLPAGQAGLANMQSDDDRIRREIKISGATDKDMDLAIKIARELIQEDRSIAGSDIMLTFMGQDKGAHLKAIHKVFEHHGLPADITSLSQKPRAQVLIPMIAGAIDEIQYPSLGPLSGARLASSERASVRKKAIEALGRIGLASPEVIQKLVDAVEKDKSLAVQAAAIKALGLIGYSDKKVMAALVEAGATKGKLGLGYVVIESLGLIGDNDKEAVDLLNNTIQADQNQDYLYYTAGWAMRALGQMGATDKKTLKVLWNVVEDQEYSNMGDMALETLGRLSALGRMDRRQVSRIGKELRTTIGYLFQDEEAQADNFTVPILSLLQIDLALKGDPHWKFAKRSLLPVILTDGSDDEVRVKKSIETAHQMIGNVLGLEKEIKRLPKGVQVLRRVNGYFFFEEFERLLQALTLLYEDGALSAEDKTRVRDIVIRASDLYNRYQDDVVDKKATDEKTNALLRERDAIASKVSDFLKRTSGARLAKQSGKNVALTKEYLEKVQIRRDKLVEILDGQTRVIDRNELLFYLRETQEYASVSLSVVYHDTMTDPRLRNHPNLNKRLRTKPLFSKRPIELPRSVEGARLALEIPVKDGVEPIRPELSSEAMLMLEEMVGPEPDTFKEGLRILNASMDSWRADKDEIPGNVLKDSYDVFRSDPISWLWVLENYAEIMSAVSWTPEEREDLRQSVFYELDTMWDVHELDRYKNILDLFYKPRFYFILRMMVLLSKATDPAHGKFVQEALSFSIVEMNNTSEYKNYNVPSQAYLDNTLIDLLKKRPDLKFLAPIHADVIQNWEQYLYEGREAMDSHNSWSLSIRDKRKEQAAENGPDVSGDVKAMAETFRKYMILKKALKPYNDDTRRAWDEPIDYLARKASGAKIVDYDIAGSHAFDDGKGGYSDMWKFVLGWHEEMAAAGFKVWVIEPEEYFKKVFISIQKSGSFIKSHDEMVANLQKYYDLPASRTPLSLQSWLGLESDSSTETAARLKFFEDLKKLKDKTGSEISFKVERLAGNDISDPGKRFIFLHEGDVTHGMDQLVGEKLKNEKVFSVKHSRSTHPSLSEVFNFYIWFKHALGEHIEESGRHGDFRSVALPIRGNKRFTDLFLDSSGLDLEFFVKHAFMVKGLAGLMRGDAGTEFKDAYVVTSIKDDQEEEAQIDPQDEEDYVPTKPRVRPTVPVGARLAVEDEYASGEDDQRASRDFWDEARGETEFRIRLEERRWFGGEIRPENLRWDYPRFFDALIKRYDPLTDYPTELMTIEQKKRVLMGLLMNQTETVDVEVIDRLALRAGTAFESEDEILSIIQSDDRFAPYQHLVIKKKLFADPNAVIEKINVLAHKEIVITNHERDYTGIVHRADYSLTENKIIISWESGKKDVFYWPTSNITAIEIAADAPPAQTSSLTLDKHDLINFSVLVYDATRKTGKIALGSQILGIRVEGKDLFVEGLGRGPVVLSNYRLHVLKARRAYNWQSGNLDLSMKELKEKLGLDSAAADSILAQQADLLQKTPVVVTLDLSLFDKKTFASHIAPLLLLETQKLYKKYPNSLRFILKGDSGRASEIFRQAQKRNITAESFLFQKAEDLPEAFKDGKAKYANVASSASAQSGEGRFVYVKPLGEKDVLDVATVVKLALIGAVADPKTNLFQDFVRAYRSVTGLDLSDTNEFLSVIEGREKDLKVLAKYAVIARPIDIQYALRMYQLMIKMAEQAA